MHNKLIPSHVPVLSAALSAVLLSLGLFGCGREPLEIRRYQEYAPVAAVAPTDHSGHDHAGPVRPPEPPAAPSVSAAPLQWTAPDGWNESAGSGMRLVTFTAGDGADAITCTIISLAGQAGGLKQNIQRWLGQVKIELPDEKLDAYLSTLPSISLTDGNTGLIADFDALLSEPDAPSMVTGIFERGGQTVFIKMTGSRGSVAREKEAFLTLCRSLK